MVHCKKNSHDNGLRIFKNAFGAGKVILIRGKVILPIYVSFTPCYASIGLLQFLYANLAVINIILQL